MHGFTAAQNGMGQNAGQDLRLGVRIGLGPTVTPCIMYQPCKTTSDNSQQQPFHGHNTDQAALYNHCTGWLPPHLFAAKTMPT